MNLIEYVVESQRKWFTPVGNELHLVDVICSIYDYPEDHAKFAQDVIKQDCPGLEYIGCIFGSPRDKDMSRKEEYRTFIFALPVTPEVVNSRCTGFNTKLGDVI